MSMLFHELLDSNATLEPKGCALTYRDQTTTYWELNEAAAAVAGGLAEQGIRPLDRIAVFLDKRIETVTSFLACLLYTSDAADE